MKTLEQIGIHAVKEHILKNWMTHDGMWFFHSLQAHGVDEANRLNKAAIRSLAAIELKRAQSLFGLTTEGVDTFDDLRDLVDAAFSVSKGDFMRFTYTFPEKNVLRWEWDGSGCFAYQGMQRMGAIDRYECGVLFRVLCWIESAGVRYAPDRELKGCRMHMEGRCAGEVRFFFP
ncbi:MAG TPA: DUF6125 family protein [Deltaproteobacteria bacterium]|nr:DUF6125 family protein [Deltaproteobacteria bacterium]HPR54694.1 DUF6125 family protein [Deltaproteobacteria bacterium]HXK46642.1 DUF6125 family protein [Deltaproteobacteria bacterium]